MAPFDALLLKGDADPATRPVMTMVLGLGRTPDRARLRDAFARTADALPQLRSCVIRTSWSLGQPQWVPDDGFDVDDHLREVGAPGDRGWQDVLAVASALATAPPFDPARPCSSPTCSSS